MHLDRDSLVIGLLAGAMIAGVGGMVLRRIRQAQLGMGAPDKPMTVKTSGTPREVMKAAAAAFRTCLFWTIVWVCWNFILVIKLFRVHGLF